MRQTLLRSSMVGGATVKNSLTQHFKVRSAHTVRVILTSDLQDGKGYAGEVHHVKAGYARNFLIPDKKALYATPFNFKRVGLNDPDLVAETAEQRKLRESQESDEDLKAADKLKYYLRNKTLKIWRNVDLNALEGGKGLVGAPIHPGKVDHINVRSKLSKQLKIDLEEHEKVQIHPEPIPHSTLEESKEAMENYLDKMKKLEEGENCDVQLKTLGEYLVKIHLSGDYTVGLRLNVLKR